MEKVPSFEREESTDEMSNVLVVEGESFVNVELHMDDNDHNKSNNSNNNGLVSADGNQGPAISQALFQNAEDNDEEDEDENDDDDDDDDDDSGTDHVNAEKLGTQLQRFERQAGVISSLPDTFQTNHLLFYERFKAYQDYMLGDCKPSEVKSFIADYLEKVVEPCDWLALWSTHVFDVLVEVQDVDYKDLKACVSLVLPLQCDTRGYELTEDAMKCLLEATQHRVSMEELQVVYEESGDFDQTALALEHLRFFYKHIWREWDEEDEDDDFDYFVRCVEPRLRLYYDMLEDRVPTGLVAEYQSLLQNSSQCFQEFSVLRSGISSDSDSELDNVSMVEGLKLHDQLETLKRKLHIIENPVLRYVLGYKGNASQQSVESHGPRESGLKVIHVVTTSCSTIQLQSLLSAKLLPLCCSDETEIQFHREPVSAVESCHQGDMVIVLPGVYSISSPIFIPDSITIEGFGFPDDVVIEKKCKGDSFVESTGADVKLSNIKFIQHDAIDGILCVRQGTLNLENCVLQCQTTGVIVRTSACLNMNMCDLYGSKGAGVEIYPGSICRLVSNGIHHCKDGILIKDFVDELNAVMPSITMENNVIHNNEGYGVILVKPNTRVPQDCEAEAAEQTAGDKLPVEPIDPLPASAAAEVEVIVDAKPESTEDSNGTSGDMVYTSGRKWQFSRQLSRNKELCCTSRPVQDLLAHPVFVSIQGNQFKRNGKSDFGTFFY